MNFPKTQRCESEGQIQRTMNFGISFKKIEENELSEQPYLFLALESYVVF